jgi:hypothetical protein
MSPRKRSALSCIGRDAHLASRTASDLHAAQPGPETLAEHVARREVRGAAFRGGAPVYLRRRRTGTPTTAPSAPQMSPLGALAVIGGLIVLIGGTVACAVTGDWAAMILVVIFGLGPMLWAGRGGRDGLKKK